LNVSEGKLKNSIAIQAKQFYYDILSEVI